MVNKRLEDLAKRYRNPGFLEAEARKAEEFRRLEEEERRKVRETIATARIAKVEQIVHDEQTKEALTAYVKGINSYEGSDIDTAHHAFVTHPDFPIIYNQLNTIPNAGDKWAFILRKAYEIGQDVDLFIGSIFQHNSVQSQRKLEEQGIYLLCPYFRENEASATREECLIDGEPIMSVCRGEYPICNIFRDRAQKSAAGELRLPEFNRTQPKVKIPKIEVDPVDLQDLDDWWKMEGKYE